MTIVNLMPHALVVVSDAGTRTFAPSGSIARCASVSEAAGEFDDIALARTTFGAVTGLPDPVDGTLFVVSALVRAAVPHRTDVASPGDLVRDSAGNVVGCKGLVIN